MKEECSGSFSQLLFPLPTKAVDNGNQTSRTKGAEAFVLSNATNKNVPALNLTLNDPRGIPRDIKAGDRQRKGFLLLNFMSQNEFHSAFR